MARSATPKALVLDRLEHGATIRLPERRRAIGARGTIDVA
jgi:hypothetical protein